MERRKYGVDKGGLFFNLKILGEYAFFIVSFVESQKNLCRGVVSTMISFFLIL